MKLILAQPAIPRFQWELEVLLTNLSQLDGFNLEVVLLFTEKDFTVPTYLADKYGVEVHTYYDERPQRGYVPSKRAWVWWKYLSEDRSREQETYFYIDSDLVFREWPDFSKIGATEDTWVGSDCKSYITWDDYLKNVKKGEQIAANMARICGITVEQLKAAPGPGAQWVLVKPTAEFFLRLYEDCENLYAYLRVVSSDIQSWTADMWAIIYGAIREGKTVKTHPELDFCTATDDVAEWNKVKILHNAGVTGDENMFFKGKYVNSSPLGQDFSNVRTDKCTIKYVEALKKVVL